MNIWDNAENYRPCKKKIYEIRVCRPPLGTIVINKLEQSETVRQQKGKTVFTVNEVGQNPYIQQIAGDLVHKGAAYITTPQYPYVVCGIAGELYTISETELKQGYAYVNSSGCTVPFTADNFKPTVTGQPVWVTLQSQPDNLSLCACFVPKQYKGSLQIGAVQVHINEPGWGHGFGDFVVAELQNGTPNLNTRRVVNGVIFERTYDNRGWVDCLRPQKERGAVAVSNVPYLGTYTKREMQLVFGGDLCQE